MFPYVLTSPKRMTLFKAFGRVHTGRRDMRGVKTLLQCTDTGVERFSKNYVTNEGVGVKNWIAVVCLISRLFGCERSGLHNHRIRHCVGSKIILDAVGNIINCLPRRPSRIPATTKDLSPVTFTTASTRNE